MLPADRRHGLTIFCARVEAHTIKHGASRKHGNRSGAQAQLSWSPSSSRKPRPTDQFHGAGAGYQNLVEVFNKVVTASALSAANSLAFTIGVYVDGVLPA